MIRKYVIKIVPKATPNADGTWVVREVDLPKRMPTWREAEAFFAQHIPDGFFMVDFRLGDHE